MGDNLKARIAGAGVDAYDPTGAVPWPTIVIEGEEKAGKSWAAAAFSGSSLVGQTYWLDLSEDGANQYGAVPGARYKILRHQGTWRSIYAAVESVAAEARAAHEAKEPPVVLVIDSMSKIWTLLSEWADYRARNSDKSKEKLQRDPDAEIIIGHTYWNDATARHKKLMQTLLDMPAIVVLTARGKMTSAFDEAGKPIPKWKADSTIWKVEGQKDLTWDASLHVRMFRDAKPEIIGGRSTHLDLRSSSAVKGLNSELGKMEFSIENLVFKVLKCDPSTAAGMSRVRLEPNERGAESLRIRDAALECVGDAVPLRALYMEAKSLGVLEAVVENEVGDQEPLHLMLTRLSS